MPEVGIGRDQELATFPFRGVQQLTVGQRGPAKLVGSDHLMLPQRVPQRFGRALIEEYAHLDGGQSASCSVLQHRTGLIERDAGEPFHELLDGRPILQILE